MDKRPWLLERRPFLGIAAMAPPVAAFGMAEVPPVVETNAGRVRGAWAQGVANFKGVRYGAQSPQRAIGLAEAAILRGLTTDCPLSEDCLFLNVWPSSPSHGAARPVMFWLHGGGFVAGSSASTVYDGTRLAARREVVVITINHRLGLFGHYRAVRPPSFICWRGRRPPTVPGGRPRTRSTWRSCSTTYWHRRNSSDPPRRLSAWPTP